MPENDDFWSEWDKLNEATMDENDEKQVDSNYGPVVMGRNKMGKAISLPEELRDGGTISFDNEIPIGWEYEGVLHFFPGKGPADFPPGWSYEGLLHFAEEEEGDNAETD